MLWAYSAMRNVFDLQFCSGSGMKKSYYLYCLKLHESILFYQGKPSLTSNARLQQITSHGAKPKLMVSWNLKIIIPLAGDLPRQDSSWDRVSNCSVSHHLTWSGICKSLENERSQLENFRFEQHTRKREKKGKGNKGIVTKKETTFVSE